MKRQFIIIIGLLTVMVSYSQHCPWDCAGMILIKTDVPKERFQKMNVVLADEKGYAVTDTMYGTGLATYDECRFLSYEEFKNYRAGRTGLHHWYGYDTIYYFAEGLYMVKFNFCRYKNQKLYIKFLDAYDRSARYHFTEVADSLRVHLHEYSTQLSDKQTEKLKQDLLPFIMYFNCDRWLLQEEDCQ